MVLVGIFHDVFWKERIWKNSEGKLMDSEEKSADSGETTTNSTDSEETLQIQKPTM